MAYFTTPANNEDGLAEMLRDLSEAEITKVEANLRLRRAKDQCLAGDKVAQALADEIRAGVVKAQSRFQSAKEAAKRKDELVRKARVEQDHRTRHEATSWARYREASQTQYELVYQQRVIPRSQHQCLREARVAVQEAQKASEQAEQAFTQAWHKARKAQAKAEKCFDEMSARQTHGELAINAVRAYQSRRSGVIWEDIQCALDDEDECETVYSQ